MMSRNARRMLVLVALSLAVLMLSACGPSKVNVTLDNYKIALDKDTIPPGDVIFHITSVATDQKHEFVIFKTDLAGDKMPRNADNNVNEEGPGITHITEAGDIGPGTSTDLTAKLEAGHYVLLCNLPGHYDQGMFVEFTVK